MQTDERGFAKLAFNDKRGNGSPSLILSHHDTLLHNLTASLVMSDALSQHVMQMKMHPHHHHFFSTGFLFDIPRHNLNIDVLIGSMDLAISSFLTPNNLQLNVPSHA